MLIESLKIFCDVTDLNSFSRAADQNYVTQSSVSQQIRNLEKYWKTPLLNRSRRELSLTPAGQTLYREAKIILARYNHLNRQLQKKSEAVTGSVKISAIHGVGLHELPPYMKRFIQMYPQVNVQLEYKKDSDVYNEVLRKSSDLGIVAYPKERAGLTVIPFKKDEMRLICSPDHPIGKMREVPLKRLINENFVAFEKNLPTRHAVDEALAHAKTQVNIIMEFDNIETVKRAIEIGAGISILPLATVNQELESRILRAVKISGTPLVRPLGILSLKSRLETPAVARFVEVLTQP